MAIVVEVGSHDRRVPDQQQGGRAQLDAFVAHEANTVPVARLDGRIVGSLTLVVFR
jgi:hypothetical protein